MGGDMGGAAQAAGPGSWTVRGSARLGRVAPGEPGPITADAPPGIAGGPLLTQVWLDLAFVHWAVPPSAVAPLLPPGVRPDTLHGVTYVGLVAFRMHRAAGSGCRACRTWARSRRRTCGCTRWTATAAGASSSEDVVAAAGVPGPLGAPDSVLYSPGVPVRFGRPHRPAGIPTP